MRVLLVPAFILAATALPGADDKKNEADLKAVVGKWDVAKAEIGGKDVTDFFKKMDFEILGAGKYKLKLGDEKDEGTFTVDASKEPKEMDVKPTGGPNKGRTIKAIYKLDGDTMDICYQLEDVDKRPTKFESKPDTKLFLVTYKRKKS